jgi:hypothetical protein
MRDEIKSISELENVELVFDKTVDNGCSKRRPDVRIECLTHTIIIECDENEHRNTQCEEKRMMQLFQDLGNRPLVMIRFNPDGYSEDDEKFQGCFTPSEKGLVINKKEWKKRIEVLIPIIKKYISNPPEKELTIKY